MSAPLTGCAGSAVVAGAVVGEGDGSADAAAGDPAAGTDVTGDGADSSAVPAVVPQAAKVMVAATRLSMSGTRVLTVMA